tara:strand:- start:2143 stop:2313 length:171 start_codon:yes stop_codon:yes gene_type:complete
MITDQYGRLFAVLVFAPYLIYSGYKHNDKILCLLGLLLFVYELFWICNKGPQVIYL